LCRAIVDVAGVVVTERTPVTMTRSELKATVVLGMPPLLLPPLLPDEPPPSPPPELTPELPPDPLLPEAPLLLDAPDPPLLPLPPDEPVLPELLGAPLLPLPLPPDDDGALPDPLPLLEPLLLLPVTGVPVLGALHPQMPAPARPASIAPRAARAQTGYTFICFSS
jgi:hypothetical protein